MCVNLENLGHCGALKDDAPLCLLRPGAAEGLDLRVKDRARVQAPADAELGQREDGDPRCDTEYVLTVILDRPREVFAVRAWYVAIHLPPLRYTVQVEDAPGQWRRVFETTENTEAFQLPFGQPPGLANPSVPITTPFPPLRTQRLRLTMKCNLTSPTQPALAGDPVWLFEIEVFGRISRAEAWWRSLFGAS